MSKYIDAEEAMHAIDRERTNRIDFNNGLIAAIIAVNREPAADVEEVKHGEWIEDFMIGEGVYRCTNCDDKFVTLEGTPYDNRLLYCPFCGAKMDGKEQTDDEL